MEQIASQKSGKQGLNERGSITKLIQDMNTVNYDKEEELERQKTLFEGFESEINDSNKLLDPTQTIGIKMRSYAHNRCRKQRAMIND